MLQQEIKTSGIDIHLHNSVHLIPRLINIKALQWVMIFSFGPLVLFLSGYINKYNPGTGDDSNERGRRSRRGSGSGNIKRNVNGGNRVNAGLSGGSSNQGNNGRDGSGNNNQGNGEGEENYNIRLLINIIFFIVRLLKVIVFPTIRNFLSRHEQDFIYMLLVELQIDVEKEYINSI